MKTFTIEVGPIRATGAPAMLIAATGAIVAGGIAMALARASDRLPETIRETNNLTRTLRSERSFLNP